MGVVRDLPRVPVGIGEVAGVAAPEDLLRRLEDARARLRGRFEGGVDVGFRRDVSRERDPAEARAFGRNVRVLGEGALRVEREDDAAPSRKTMCSLELLDAAKPSPST